MFGVAMAPSNGLKTLSTGWQVNIRYLLEPGALCADSLSGMGRWKRVKTPVQFFNC